MSAPPQQIDAAASNPLEGLLGYQIRRASGAVLASLGKSFAEIGLTVAEGSIVVLIEANPGVTQSEIGRLLSIKRANMAPLTAGLTAKGLLQRAPADGRSHRLLLTPEGKTLAAETRRRVAEHEASLCPGASAEQRRQLAALLEDIWKG